MLTIGSGVLAPAGAAVPDEAFVGLVGTAQNLTSAASHTWAGALTNGSGATRMVVLGIGTDTSTDSETFAATYNGVAASEIVGLADRDEGSSTVGVMFRWGGSDLPGDMSSHNFVVTPTLANETLAAQALEYIGVADASAEDVDEQPTDNPSDVDMSVSSTAGALVVHLVLGGINTREVSTWDNSQNVRSTFGASNPTISFGMADLIGVSAGTVTSGATEAALFRANGANLRVICQSSLSERKLK